MILDSKFLKMEEEVLLKIFEKNSKYYEILLQQYRNIIETTRKFSSCGFFINYMVDKSNCKIIDENIVLNSVYGIINNNINVGFLLYIKDGYITMLECYEYDSKDFPDLISNYNLYCK